MESTLEKTQQSMRWLRNAARAQLSSPTATTLKDAEALTSGGFQWGCDQMDLMADYLKRQDVRTALHLESVEPSGFSYARSGPASVLLYPELMKKIRVLIYNGDADACVPYKGNEEWTTGLAAQGYMEEKSAWHPWMVGSDSIPAGYATTYNVSNAEKDVGDFTFITIRLAGHMVPAFQPRAALSFFTRFLARESF